MLDQSSKFVKQSFSENKFCYPHYLRKMKSIGFVSSNVFVWNNSFVFTAADSDLFVWFLFYFFLYQRHDYELF